MGVFSGRREVARKVRVDSKYWVSEDGMVWSGALPLEPIGGVGVNLHGKRVKIAYLVARAFVPNGECRRWVRHKNGDVKDNRASNLEWSDEKEVGRRGPKPKDLWVRAWNLEGDVVGIWRNLREASDATGAPVGSIRLCLAGKQKRAGGLLWSRV